MRRLPSPRALRTPFGSLLAASALAAGLSFAQAARAQADGDRATARALGQAGQKALDAKDYKSAEDDFRRADSLVHAPTLLLGLARSLAGEGKFVEAQEAYRRIVREGVAPGAPEVFSRAVDEAKQEVDGVSARIGGMTIRVQGADGKPVAGVKVTIDDAPISAASLGVRRLVDPGNHLVKASADGYKAAQVQVTVAPGGSSDAPLTLQVDASAPPTPASNPVAPTPEPSNGSNQPAPATEPSSGPSIWPWVALGVGGAGLVVGGITGGLAVSDHSSLTSTCKPACGPSQQSDLSSYHTMATVSTVGFIVGGVGAAVGVTLLLLQPSAAPAAPTTGLHVEPAIGLGSIGATGTF